MISGLTSIEPETNMSLTLFADDLERLALIFTVDRRIDETDRDGFHALRLELRNPLGNFIRIDLALDRSVVGKRARRFPGGGGG